jgi:hypothetical protein
VDERESNGESMKHFLSRVKGEEREETRLCPINILFSGMKMARSVGVK